jgi:uncharacterized membrane protein
MGFLRKNVLAGILVVAPVALTFYIVMMMVRWVDAAVGALLPAAYQQQFDFYYHIPGMGLVMAFVFLVVIGAIARSVLGQLVVRMGESILAHIPIMRGLYGALKQIFQTVLTNKSDAFRKVVLVEFPRRDAWTLGFVTGPTAGEAQEKIKDTTVNVFVPTTPNPTSGFLLMVPQRDVVPLDMTVEQGIKMVVSGGIITPPKKITETIDNAAAVP